MQVIRAASKVLDAVSYSFSPRVGATAREVRINGALCVGAGFLALIASFPIMYFLPPKWSAQVVMVPALLVYALWLIGGYRIAFAANPTSSGGPFGSIIRIAFGISFIVAMFGLLIAIVWAIEKLSKLL
jgi:hypothetical protein